MNAEINYAIQNGLVDLSCLQKEIEMRKRDELLGRHPYKIWKGKNGRWSTYLPDGEKGRIQRSRGSRKEIEDVVVSYWKMREENPTIREVFEEWNDRRLELKKIVNATHLRNINVFNRHYKEFGKKRIKSVDAEAFGEFLERQIPEHNLTSKAFSNLKTVTRGFLKRAKKRKLVAFNIEEMLQDLDTSDSEFLKVIKEDYEEVFDEYEMDKMISYLKENLDMLNTGILLMFVTGIRIGETVVLKHTDFKGNTFHIRRTETRFLNEDGKYVCEVKEFPKSQAGVRTAIIPEDYAWLTKRLQLLNPFEEYIFVKDKTRISTQSMRMRLKRLCKKLGIYHKSPHKIRKTYGSILLDNHVDKKLIIGQMGHTNITCTENYYHRNRRSIEKKSQIISDIPEFRIKNDKNE